MGTSEPTRVAMKRIAPAWMQRIERLGKLGPGWDGYGAKPISASAIQQCMTLLDSIGQRAVPNPEELFIAPLADGGLELDWDSPSGKELMIVVPPEGSPIRFLLTTFDSAGCERECSGTIAEDDSLDRLLLEFSA